jgi:Zn-dependent peptidase ImmA (M78 family)
MSAIVTTINSGLAKLLPEKLTEAREASGLNMTELSEHLGISRQAVSRYELGTLIPSPEVMTKIAAILQQPLIFFTASRITSKLASGPAFFRSYKSTSATSRKVCLRQGQWLIDGYTYLSKFINFPDVKVEEFSQERYLQEEIEDIAKKCRRFWGLGDGPIFNMVELLEANGFIVAKARFGGEKIDAFSFWHGNRPFIFLGADKSSCARSRFDAAHELGHMVLHNGISEDELEDPDILKRVEKEADNFASAFLLPLSSFPQEVYSSKLAHFVELKRRWNVSMAAMIYRCASLEIFNDEQVLNMRKQMSMQKMRKNEPLDDSIPTETPSTLAKAAKLLLENKIILGEDFIHEIKLSTRTIENLFNLATGTLEPESRVARISLRSV